MPPHIGHFLVSSVTSRPTLVSLAPALRLRGGRADAPGMPSLPRYSVSILAVVGAILATFAVFTLARPQYHPRYESKMIDFSKQDYYRPAALRQAFAAQGIKLHGAEGHAPGFLLLSNAPAPGMQTRSRW